MWVGIYCSRRNTWGGEQQFLLLPAVCSARMLLPCDLAAASYHITILASNLTNSIACCVASSPIAACAFWLQLEVRELASNTVRFKGAVGTTVNNALHIAAHSNGEWASPAPHYCCCLLLCSLETSTSSRGACLMLYSECSQADTQLSRNLLLTTQLLRHQHLRDASPGSSDCLYLSESV